MTFWICEKYLGSNTPPPKNGDSRAPLGLRRPRGAATSHPHSSTTTCRRKNGRRCPTSAKGERGNRPPRDGSLAPPPLFLRRCLLIFFFRTPNYIEFSSCFLATWAMDTAMDTRPQARLRQQQSHNTRTKHSSVQPSPLAVRRIGSASAFGLA